MSTKQAYINQAIEGMGYCVPQNIFRLYIQALRGNNAISDQLSPYSEGQSLDRRWGILC
jgi:hypothetical protein